ncbi:MAG: hypothetical protein KF795_18795 [Labilithrix sp.]|nr:hypothetical protein [Labilithrix sp.]
MKISKIQKGLVLLSIVAATLVAGCELIVDFDRTKIPAETNEASVPDANVADTGPVEEVDASDDADAGEPEGDASDEADAADAQ